VTGSNIISKMFRLQDTSNLRCFGTMPEVSIGPGGTGAQCPWNSSPLVWKCLETSDLVTVIPTHKTF